LDDEDEFASQFKGILEREKKSIISHWNVCCLIHCQKCHFPRDLALVSVLQQIKVNAAHSFVHSKFKYMHLVVKRTVWPYLFFYQS
jgi:hypothetical protein